MSLDRINLCFIPWVDWDSYLHSRPHQLVKEALGRGHRVLYLNPGSRSAFKDGNFEVWHPLSNQVFEVVRSALRGELFANKQNTMNRKLTRGRRLIYRPYENTSRWSAPSKIIIDWLTKKKFRAFQNPMRKNVVIFEQPFPSVFCIPYLKKLGYLVIYDLIDDWSAYQDAPGYFLETEPYLFRNADIVTVTAKSLYEKAVRFNKNTHLCPNAADLEHFSRSRERWERPRDLPDGKPIAGFFGIIREWFDVDLIRYAALQRPQIEFCLIGGYSETVFEQLKDLRNVHFLGHQDYAVLPQYLHYFDVTLIPFVINNLIRSTNPIKVYEYLAGGKPVVASAVPEIKDMPFVYLSKSKEEFVRNLDQTMGTNPDLKVIDCFLSNHTWSKRFDVIEEAISNSFGVGLKE